MREAPDVILIGEIRDQETMKQALTYAETGHLCLATMHANNSNLALERIVNFFPEDAHKIILQDIALNLNAIIAQRLCIGLEEKRVAAVKIMMNTPFISQLIEKGKIEEIKEAMTRSKGKVNQTFDDALYNLVKEGKVSRKEALRKADSANNLVLRFRLEDGDKSESSADGSEFSVNHAAPFDHYHTYNINPLKVKSKTPYAQKKLTAAIMAVMNQRGLEFKMRDPDIEVQIVLSYQAEEGLKLEAIEGQSKPTEFINDSKEQALLIINVIDRETEKPIFRISAARKTADLNETQQQLNQGIAGLLRKLPVGKHSESA